MHPGAPPGAEPPGPDDDLPAPDDLPRSVRALLRLALVDGRPDRDVVARWLDLSTRTMQRRLAEAGTSFADLLRTALHARAADLLARGASVTEVAGDLGYADAAHFTRAFTAWTGLSPRAWKTARAVSAPPRRSGGP